MADIHLAEGDPRLWPRPMLLVAGAATIVAAVLIVALDGDERTVSDAATAWALLQLVFLPVGAYFALYWRLKPARTRYVVTPTATARGVAKTHTSRRPEPSGSHGPARRRHS